MSRLPGAEVWEAAAWRLPPAAVAALAELIGPAAGEAALREDSTREAIRRAAGDAYTRGEQAGYYRAVAEAKAVEHGLVADLGVVTRRWHVQCRRHRLEGCPRLGVDGVCPCPDCETRSRAAFARPMPGEYLGGPVAWEEK